MRCFLVLSSYLRVGPGFWGEGGQGRGEGDREEKKEKVMEGQDMFLRIHVPPCVCDQIAALTERLSTDYALVRLFP